MVTNPATRDWTVTASLFATLNDMFGNRTICGIGRGDSAVRVINGEPVTLATLRESIEVIRALANGEQADLQGQPAAVPVERRVAAADLGGRLRPEGARADRRGRRRVHPAARRSGHHRLVDRRRAQGRGGRRPRSRVASRSAWPRRPTSPTEPTPASGARAQTSAGGSAAWSATTSPTSWRATAPTARRCPRRCRTTSPGARATTTTPTARPATRTPTSFLTRSSTGSACSVRRSSTWPGWRSCAHSASTSSRSTCSTTRRTARSTAYGEQIIPEVRIRPAART